VWGTHAHGLYIASILSSVGPTPAKLFNLPRKWDSCTTGPHRLPCVRKYHVLSREALNSWILTQLFCSLHSDRNTDMKKYIICQYWDKKSKISIWERYEPYLAEPWAFSAHFQKIYANTNPRTGIVWNTTNYEENNSRWGAYFKSDCFGHVLTSPSTNSQFFAKS
jgi:hypothetical protein